MPTTAASAPREWRRGEWVVCDDPARIDLAGVHAFIATMADPSHYLEIHRPNAYAPGP
jgi:hypothetical protein